MKNLALIFSLMALTLLGFSCAKKNDNNVVTYQLNQMGQCVDSQNGTIVNQTLCTNGYQYVNGLCVQTSTGQQVSAQLCQQSTNGFQLNQYGQCVQTTTGQIVATQLCQQSTNGFQLNQYGQCVQTTTGQIVATQLCQQMNNGMQACVGQYYYPQYQTYVNCTTNAYGANTCSRMQLVSVSTGQQVYCQ